MADFCQDFINEPVHLQTLVRLSGPAIDCPFTGKFTFTYKTGKVFLNPEEAFLSYEKCFPFEIAKKFDFEMANLLLLIGFG